MRPCNKANAAAAGTPAAGTPAAAAAVGSAMAPPQSKPMVTVTPTTASARITAPAAAAGPSAGPSTGPSAEYTSYEISPYRAGGSSDSDEEDDARRQRKPVPAWARSEALVPMLARQALVDPDHIFGRSSKTISLDQVFAGQGGPAAAHQVGD